jgi:hypothetical protein
MSRIVFHNTLSIPFNTLMPLYVVEERNLEREWKTSCNVLGQCTSSSKEPPTMIKRS